MNFEYELGIEAKSRINGFSGIVTSRAEHLNGCNRYWVEPKKLNKDGEVVEGRWFDAGELIQIGKNIMERTNSERGGFSSKTK